MPRDTQTEELLNTRIVLGASAPITVKSAVEPVAAHTISPEPKLTVRMPNGREVRAVALVGDPDGHRPVRVIVPGISGMKTLRPAVESVRALAAKAVTPDGQTIDLTARALAAPEVVAKVHRNGTDQLKRAVESHSKARKPQQWPVGGPRQS